MKIDLSKFNCAGCSACANICPAKAISMRQNEEGFYVPYIDEEKCTNCGLCYKVCPENNPVQKNTKTPECYAVMAKDDIRMKSSSGGAFTIIANEIFANGGVVAGAAFDENWTVRHIIIDDRKDIDRLRGSKYVQSFISEDLYKQLKAYLEKDRWVLFTGTPCQTAGFKSYLKKDYEKLILVDLLCSGNPSPKIFKKYLEYINPNNSSILKINFRDKEKNGWSCTHTTTATTTGTFTDNKFMHAFLSKTIRCKTCNECKYATVDKVSDVTIADFWAIDRYKKELDDKKGTSIYLANTPKGKNLFEKIKSNFKVLEEVPLKYAMQPIMFAPYKDNPRRNKFFKDINDKTFNEVYEKWFGIENNIGIMNFWYVPNRGAILTNYALHEFLKENGYNPQTINYYPRHEYHTHRNSIAERFANKFIKKTNFCKDYIELKNLNNSIKTFIVGSDQVFRNWCVHPHKDKYFFNWVNENAKKIACSASFGLPYFDGNEYEKTLMQKYLKRFDALSVRESSGVDILKNDYGLDSVQIIDPVFWIERSIYEKIIADSKQTEKNFLAYYFIWSTDEKQKSIKYLSDKLGIKAVDIKQNMPVEDWLYYIYNCNLLVTDSFHGSCFASMFKKNFITISPWYNKYDDRMSYLLSLLKLDDKQVKCAKEIQERPDLLSEIDYSKVDTTLIENEVNRAKQWLLNALEAPKSEKEYSSDDKVFFAVMDRMNILRDENTRLALLKAPEPPAKTDLSEVCLLIDEKKIQKQYCYYRFASNLVFGRQKQNFLNKKKELKEKLKKIKELKNKN